jgi:hypothetical protein
MTLLALVTISNVASAQANASATIGVTITNPISIYQSSNLNFGGITVSPNSGGSIVLDPDGKETSKGGVSINGDGDGAPASFVISGQGGYTYSISIPSDTISLDEESAGLLNISNFTTSPDITGPMLQSGTQKINVGATLNVEKAEESGTLTEEIPFDVQVNYN